MRNLKISSIIIILVVVMGLAGCAKLIPDASDYATPTPYPTRTPIPTVTEAPTNTPTPTPTDTVTPTPTPTVTNTPTPTWTPIPTPTSTPIPTPSTAPTPTPIPTATPTPVPVKLNSRGAVYGDPDSIGRSGNLFYDHPEIWNLERSYQYYIYYYVNGKEIFTTINAMKSLDGTYARFCGPNAPEECYFTTSYDFVVGKMIHRDPGDPEVCEWTDPDDGHTYKFTADTFVQLKLVDGTYVEITVDEYLAHPFGYDKK